MKKNLLASLLLLSSGFCFSQGGNTRKRCSTLEYEAYLQSQDPNRKAERAMYEKAVGQWIANNPNYQSRATVTIPVVVHVVYYSGDAANQNIPDAQIQTQIKTLNQDFSYTNPDASQTLAAFKSYAANTGIQFCLAQRDPSGKATTGIVRKSTNVQPYFGVPGSSDPNQDSEKFSSKGGDDAWDTKKYLNIWVCDLGSITLGYGEFPKSTTTNTYGLACNYTVFGPSTDPIYNLGRTSTHEIGHCFNLNHIWGDDANADGKCDASDLCTGTDNIADTPNQCDCHYQFTAGSVQTDKCSPSAPGTMWMNYMDYTDDAGMNMFTKDQSTRMNAVLNTAPYNALATSNGCVPVSGMGVEAVMLNNTLDVYPNPASKNVSIEFALTDDNSGSISVYNAVGQKMLFENLDKMNAGYKKYSLDVTSFTNGLYFITVKVGDSAVTRKISVVK